MAQQLTSIVYRSTKADGTPNALGTVSTYLAGTLTNAATYTTAAGDVANTNPVTLGADGCAQIWLDPALTYRFIEKTAEGTTIRDVTGLSVGITGGDLASTASGKGDALIGVKSDATNSVARTQHAKNAEMVSVRDFGAVGDGTTDDTAAFNAAIAYANSRGGVDAANIVGTTIVIPDGRYRLGALNAVTRTGCNFTGLSDDGAVLLCTPNTTTFIFGNGTDTVVGGGVSRVKVEYTSAPGSAVFVAVDYGFRLRFDGLKLVNIGILCSLGVTSSRIAGGITFNNLKGYMNNAGVPLFDLRYGAGLFITDAAVFIGGVANPTHPASMTTVAGSAVFRCNVGFWDTLQCTNAIFERFDSGLNIVAGATMVYQNFYFTNVIMDYLRRWCVYAESQSGGVVAGIRFDHTSWFVSWEEDAIFMTGAGYHDNHSFSGKVVIAGKAGVNYSVSNARSVSFADLQVNACNRLGLVNAAMLFADGSKGFTVNGCKGNVDTTAVGLPWRAPFGIQTGADADRYVITGCAFEGSAGGYNIVANTASSTYRRVSNNVNANYAGSLPLTMPATTVRVTNTTPFVWDLDFFGGTITGGYDKNSVGFPGALQYVHMRLDPGDSFACGYSSAPTVTRFIEA